MTDDPPVRFISIPPDQMAVLQAAIDAGWRLEQDPAKIEARYKDLDLANAVPRPIMYADLGVLIATVHRLENEHALAYESYTASAEALQKQLAELRLQNHRLIKERDALKVDAERERAARGIVDEALMTTTLQVTRMREELVKANDKVEAFREAPTDLAAKVQFLINHLDATGQLPEHVFCFPDGDVWEAQQRREKP